MAAFLPDDIVCNIVALLPAKPLLRFRCVSKYWNHILREPDFMKLRSRKTIIFPLPDTIHLIDDNVPTDDTSNSIVQRFYPFNALRRKLSNIRTLNVIGTLNGIVVLAASKTLTLYNPFTGVSKILPQPPGPCIPSAYGFGYGANPGDLKIVRFPQHCKSFDVYSFKVSSWSTLKYSSSIQLEHEVGHFINGSLYWIAYNRSVLIVINLKDMVRSQICLPFKNNTQSYSNLLGTMNGCLCCLHQFNNSGFDMWVMKEHGHWSKIYSLELPLNEMPFYPLCILDSRRILMVDPSENLIIYDTLKKSYKMFSIPMKGVHARGVYAMEYVESLVSLSDMCSSTLERRKNMQRRLRQRMLHVV